MVDRSNTPLKAIIFDWDYTLVTRKGQQLVTRSDDLRHRLSAIREKSTGANSASVEGSVLTRMKRFVDSAYRFLNPPHLINPNTPMLLRELISHDIAIIILSTGEQDKLEEEVNRLFDREIASKLSIHGEAIGKPRKPDPEVIRQPLAELKIEPSQQVVMIGDRFHRDMLAAVAAGVTPVLMQTGRPSEADYAMQHNQTHDTPIHIVKDLKHASAWLDERFGLSLADHLASM